MFVIEEIQTHITNDDSLRLLPWDAKIQTTKTIYNSESCASCIDRLNEKLKSIKKEQEDNGNDSLWIGKKSDT